MCFRLPQFYRASRLTTKRFRAVLTCISYRYDLRIGLELTKTSAQLKLPYRQPRLICQQLLRGQTWGYLRAIDLDTIELAEKGALQTIPESVVIPLKCDEYGCPQDYFVFRRCQSIRVSGLSCVKGELSGCNTH